MKPQSFEVFTDLLDARIQSHPEKCAYRYLDGKTTEALTYGQLATEIYRYAAVLQEHQLLNERVILIYPVGLEFMYAFYGCMFSGAIAIPASEPRRHKVDKSDLNRLLSIVEDSRPKAILTTSSIRDAMQSQLQERLPTSSLLWLTETAFAEGDPADYRRPLLKSDHLTFLQYTSGSTGTPKGVMVSHQNLMANEAMIAESYGNGPDTVIVSWLPLFHDMGLIFNMLHASYLGVPGIHMPPSAFIRQPILWLRALTEYGGTFSGGPNFAYDLCVQRVSDARKAELDLSRWSAALNGSEPVRKSTLEAFTKAFASCGFDPKAISPCYGLAEATVFASGYRNRSGFGLSHLEPQAFAEDRVVEVAASSPGVAIVGSGNTDGCGRIKIVHPHTLKSCASDEIGEVWIQGSHIAEGYWEKPAISEQTFRARLSDDEAAGTFLRTGDLGFMRGNELFFTGRLKEIIIIHGQNFYPQDIERTVEESHHALRQHCGAAFSVDVHGEEKLVVAFEVLRKFRDINFEEVFTSIRQAIAEAHDLPTHSIVLIKPKTMPKTTSGKLQRRGCRAQFLEGSLSVLAQWQAPEARRLNPPSDHGVAGSAKRHHVAALIRNAIAEITHIPADQFETKTPFIDLGLDSVGATALTGILAEHLQTDLPPTLVYDFPNLEKLTDYLTGHVGLKPTSQPEPKTKLAQTSTEPIAIVGLGCRFPGAPDVHAFWDMLASGADGIGEVPTERLDLEILRTGKSSTRRGGYLNRVDQFDPQFFGIAPLEAEAMDPQQRLLLEVVWETLAAAGSQPESLSGSATGVYLGIANVDYARIPNDAGSDHGAYFGTGTAASIAANRLSYMLNLQGPSIAVDTACSSSLVAIHMACNALRNRECDQAFSGGVNLILKPELTLTFDKAGMMSPTGSCKTFDAGADGYVRGEGCGMVLLKRLSDAQADGDRILALIRGSAINQDGRSNGLTAPNGTVQQKVIRAALEQADVATQEISYVETHGTGTPLGDPIEFGALNAVLAGDRPLEMPCRLGSVKTNIGHLEAAAGVAGLIKVVLAMTQKAIPPNLHFEQSNPHIDLEAAPFEVPTSLMDWLPNPGQKRLAGISSFGFGGTNAHVILEEAPAVAQVSLQAPRSHHLIHLSAPRFEDLRTQSQAIVHFLRRQPHAELADLAYSTNRGRQDFDHRLVITASSVEDVVEAMTSFRAGREGAFEYRQKSATTDRPVFLFSGQGSQYRDMGRELYSSQPVFRKVMAECSHLLEPHLGQSLVSLLYQNPVDDDALNQTGLTQPALFCLEYALFKLWESWGVQPGALMGHSLGEYVAAVVAGVFSLEDGLRLVAARGQFMQAQPTGGCMTSVFCEQARLDEHLKDLSDLAIAAFNGSQHLVLSGPSESMAILFPRLTKEGIRYQPLPVSHAYHSSLMDPVLEPFRSIAASVTYHPPRLPLISNLLGTQASDNIACADYWVNHIRQPVRFAQGFRHLYETGHRMFVEVGPGSALLSMGRRSISEEEANACTWLSSLPKGSPDWETLLHTLGQLYLQGTSVDWAGLDRGEQRTRLPVPAYAWQKQRYWLPQPAETIRTRNSLPIVKRRHPYLGTRTHTPAHLPGHYFWETSLLGEPFANFDDHPIRENPILPLSAYVDMARAAAAEVWEGWRCQIADLEQHKPLILRGDEAVTLQVVFETSSETSAQFFAYAQFGSVASSEWSLFASAEVFKLDRVESPGPAQEHATAPVLVSAKGILGEADESRLFHLKTFEPAEQATESASVLLNRQVQGVDVSHIKRKALRKLGAAEIYTQLTALGIQVDADFQGLHQLWVGESDALGLVKFRDDVPEMQSVYQDHPAFLDACFQVLAGSLCSTLESKHTPGIFLPMGFKAFKQFAPLQAEVWSYAQLHHGSDINSPTIVGDIQILSQSGELLALGTDLKLQHIGEVTPNLPEPGMSDHLYELNWEVKPAVIPNETQSTRGSWLIFADRRGVGNALATQLRARGDVCFVAFPGDEFTLLHDQTYLLNPASDMDIRKFLDQAKIGSQVNLQGVVHLWSLDAVSTADLDLAELEAAQSLGIGSALPLVQHLTSQDATRLPPLWLITRGAQQVVEEDTLALAQVPLWGWARTLPSEYPHLTRTLIDLDQDASDEASVGALIQALGHRDEEDQLAMRRGIRYGIRLKPRNLAEPQPFAWRKGASYLITGGLGSVGIHLASYLVEQGVQQIILSGRSAPSEKVAHQLEAFRRKGVEITVVRGDIADENAVSELVRTMETSALPLRGVFHAAGVGGYQGIADMSRDDLATQFNPKVRGTWLLFQKLKHWDLDFFLMLSSVASVWGVKGLSHYAAANHFLDAFADYGRHMGLPTVTANLGPIAGGGMATMDASGRQTMEMMGLNFLQPTKVNESLPLILKHRSRNRVLAEVNWETFKRIYDANHGSPLLEYLGEQTEAEGEAPGSLLANLSASPVPTHFDLLVEHIQDTTSRIMRLRGNQLPDPDKGFFDMGMDSLMILDLKAHLQKSLSLCIDTTVIFEHATVHALAAYLLEVIQPQTYSEKEIALVKKVDSAEMTSIADDVSQLSDAELEMVIDAEIGALTS